MKKKLTKRQKLGKWIKAAILVAAVTTGVVLIGNYLIGSPAQADFAQAIVPTEKAPMIDWVLEQTRAAGMRDVDVIRVLDCESGLNQNASLVNKDKSIDRGLWMINDRYHKEVSSECAYGYRCATFAAIKIWHKSGWKEWVCANQKGIK